MYADTLRGPALHTTYNTLSRAWVIDAHQTVALGIRRGGGCSEWLQQCLQVARLGIAVCAVRRPIHTAIIAIVIALNKRS